MIARRLSTISARNTFDRAKTMPVCSDSMVISTLTNTRVAFITMSEEEQTFHDTVANLLKTNVSDRALFPCNFSYFIPIIGFSLLYTTKAIYLTGGLLPPGTILADFRYNTVVDAIFTFT